MFKKNSRKNTEYNFSCEYNKKSLWLLVTYECALNVREDLRGIWSSYWSCCKWLSRCENCDALPNYLDVFYTRRAFPREQRLSPTVNHDLLYDSRGRGVSGITDRDRSPFRDRAEFSSSLPRPLHWYGFWLRCVIGRLRKLRNMQKKLYRSTTNQQLIIPLRWTSRHVLIGNVSLISLVQSRVTIAATFDV